MIPEHGGDRELVWEVRAGKRATVHVPKGSYAARVADKELREAERAIVALEDLFHRKETERFRPDIYLVDPELATPGDRASPAGANVGERGIVRVVQPGGTGEPVVRSLARLLIHRWFGTGTAEPFVQGIAGVAAARLGAGPSLEEADEWVRSELAADRGVSFLSLAGLPRPEGLGAHLSATSFVNFLLAQYEAEALARFLARYEPERQDEAALAAFERPLGVLDEDWTARLRRSAGEHTVRQSLGAILSLLAPYRRRHAEVLIAQVAAVALSLVLPLVSGCVVSALGRDPGSDFVCRAVAPGLDPTRLAVIVALLAAVYAAETLLGFRRGLWEDDLFDTVLTDLRERLFAQLQRLSHRFYARARLGDLTSRLGADTSTLETALPAIFGTGSLMVLTARGALLVLVARSPLVGGLLVLLLPVFVVVRRRLGSRIAQAAHEVQGLTGELTAVAQESLLAHSVVKAFGLEERAVASYRARLGAFLRAGDRLLVASLQFVASVKAALKAGQLAALGLGGALVLSGRVDAGIVVTLLLLLPEIIRSVSSLLDLPQTIQTAAAALKRATEVTDQVPDIADRPGAPALPRLSGEIRLEGLTFGYQPGRPVLSDVDLTIPAGTHVALVGPSGSGKSTVVNLLVRFWDPDQGRVLFDGSDVREVTLSSLRAQIGLVFQETFLFDTTVRDNIALARPGATDADVEAAARSARLTEVIESLPAGWDTVLGDRGLRMSAGQRQRLAIARALLRDPPLLVLDEATSALDARTEAEIAETLAEATRGRTTVSITHRLGLAAAADLVVVLDAGQVVEQGTHTELVTAGGLYQALHEEQTGYLRAGGRTEASLDATRLRVIPLFAGLAPEALAALVDQLTPERFSPGEDLVRQGEPGDKLYVIRRGEVDVYIDEGRGEHRVNTMRERDYFGELALLTGQPRSATVRAAVRTDVYSISRGDFLTLVEREPSLRRQLSSLVTQRRTAYDAAALAAGIASMEGE